MKKHLQIDLVLAVTFLGVTMAWAQTSPTPTAAPGHAAAPAKPAKKVDPTKQQDVGERKFQAYCGRCHSFPEQLSTSLTGTVVRHMRVRANLSAQDEKDILHFLAP
jgi:cytochrome c553